MILNILWILFVEIEMAAIHAVIGLFLCVTIIGIPFGLQHFKIAFSEYAADCDVALNFEEFCFVAEDDGKIAGVTGSFFKKTSDALKIMALRQ